MMRWVGAEVSGPVGIFLSYMFPWARPSQGRPAVLIGPGSVLPAAVVLVPLRLSLHFLQRPLDSRVSCECGHSLSQLPRPVVHLSRGCAGTSWEPSEAVMSGTQARAPSHSLVCAVD